MSKRPIAIDPVGCGCTECITGEYMPLDLAGFWELRRLLNGKIGNNTGIDVEGWVRSYKFRMPRAFQREVETEEVWDNL